MAHLYNSSPPLQLFFKVASQFNLMLPGLDGSHPNYTHLQQQIFSNHPALYSAKYSTTSFVELCIVSNTSKTFNENKQLFLPSQILHTNIHKYTNDSSHHHKDGLKSPKPYLGISFQNYPHLHVNAIIQTRNKSYLIAP